jgi:hypothetical protein
MKKLLLSILATVSIAAILPVSAFAASLPPPPYSGVDGVITDSHNNPINGASVIVTCDGNSLDYTTSSSNPGFYIVDFPASSCPTGSTVNVSATKGGASGFSHKKILSTTDPITINAVIVNVSILPELGALTGAAAAILGAAAFMVIRRKQLNQN